MSESAPIGATTMEDDMTIDQAIARSISHTEIVTIDGTAEMHEEIAAECEGSVDVVRQYGYVEYWGTTDDGDEWRVHVRAAAEYDEHAVRVRSTSSRDHGRCVHEAQSYDSADTSRCIRNTGHAGACVFDWRSARTA